MHVAPVGGKVEDRIADELARSVVRDVAAAAGLEDLEALRLQRRLREEDVLGARVAPKGEYGIVLEQEERIRDPARLALRDEAPCSSSPWA